MLFTAGGFRIRSYIQKKNFCNETRELDVFIIESLGYIKRKVINRLIKGGGVMRKDQIVHIFQRLSMTVIHHFPIWSKKTRLFIAAYPSPSIAASVVIVFLTLLMAFPPQGELLPTDPYVVNALTLLNTTKAGKELIRRVKRSSPGSFIYLSLGTTAKDHLINHQGDTVRGVTRVTYEISDRLILPKRVAVITNRDLVGTVPRDIIRSLAYELENVEYSFRNPQLDFPSDSPIARQTQEKIMEELDF
jgi:hypothetical protein